MEFYCKPIEFTAKHFKTSLNSGKKSADVTASIQKYGLNKLTASKKKGFFSKLFSALKDPMMIILLFSLVIAFGTKLGSFLKTGEADFSECIGILVAIILSVSITLIMEGSSEKAFETLNRIYDNLTVRVIRDGAVITVSQQFITPGDIILLESGDKIVADGRLIESSSLSVDESALTGESMPSKKDARLVLAESTGIAERRNCVFSGTFVTSGSGKMIVTSVGDSTEMGKIASELGGKKTGDSPLEQKLSKLGKIISITGIICAVLVFGLSVLKLSVTKTLTYDNIQSLFLECIILIVAAVPEGLPTIVALSLALNMIKLAKENALIKKMIATETMGAVSVICSDKTGTLTQNKMSVQAFCTGEFCSSPEAICSSVVMQNFICNSTADIIYSNGKEEFVGSGTECALIQAVKNKTGISYKDYRQFFPVLYREPFDSRNKYMITGIKDKEIYRLLIKGAPERVIERCNLSKNQKEKILNEIQSHEKKAERILCFAHKDSDIIFTEDSYKDGYVFDGFTVLSDPVRPEAKKAISDCKRAGIKVKMLTGDNGVTAFAIAKQLGIARDENQVVNASYLEGLDDAQLKRVLPKITVVARSTPLIKLRIVRALKEMGEVVAVTGDGINDAPAIRHADVGVAMGISGSEITKEAADAVLLDDSFATVVRAVSFGRNVYKNLQRFILFQLSVNLSALLFITVCALLGLPAPFNAIQLLWINVIMDGPPALTLGLEKTSDYIMNFKPVNRNESIVSLKMFGRILFNGVFIGGVILLQYLTNFLGVNSFEMGSTVFTLFILFQLFNAFNSRELGSKSIFSHLGGNKIMVITFLCVFLVHIFIVCFLSPLFSISPMQPITWIKCVAVALSIIEVSEIYKLFYRLFLRKSNKKSK